MCRCLFVLLFVAVSVGYAANIPDDYKEFNPNGSCNKTINILYRERKKCIFTFINHLIRNDTIESDGNCTNLNVMETNFSVRVHNNSNCWNQEMVTSVKTRLTMLRRLLNATKDKENDYFKDFFNDGYKCIVANKEYIKNKCIIETMKPVLVYEDNLSRVTPFLHYGKRSCLKSSYIMNCTMDIIIKECPKSKARDFLPYLQNIIVNGQCNNIKNVTSIIGTTAGSSAGSAGTIVGILLGIMGLFILGLFAMRMYKKMSIQRTESLRVSYQHQSKETSIK